MSCRESLTLTVQLCAQRKNNTDSTHFHRCHGLLFKLEKYDTPVFCVVPVVIWGSGECPCYAWAEILR